MSTKTPMPGARLAVGAMLLGVVLAVTAGTAAAQKPPWEVGEVKTSGKALSPKGSEDTVFDGDGKELNVFLYVTVKYDKAPTVNSIQAARILDKNKKKFVGQLFNFMVAKDDKKSVTLIFQNTNTKAWEDIDDLHLRASGHTAQLGKR